MSTYLERIDRNLGIITPAEQERLRNSTVAIAGCGGMGGLIAAQLARIGVGSLKLADNQSFDVSNLNRQFGANLSTMGKNKALSTYSEIRRICDDVDVEVFPEGITPGNVDQFLDSVDIVCDEIEFFEIGARVVLHRAARDAKIKVLNCNVIAFGTRIFLFTPTSMTVEEFLDVNVDTELSDEVVLRLVERLAPQLPPDLTERVMREWVLEQHKAPIFGGTPPISSGIVINRLCLEILGIDKRPWIKPLPAMPAYAYFDSGTFESGVVTEKWW